MESASDGGRPSDTRSSVSAWRPPVSRYLRLSYGGSREKRWRWLWAWRWLRLVWVRPWLYLSRFPPPSTSVVSPLLSCFVFVCCVSVSIAFLVFCVMDRKLDASMDAIEQAEEEEPFRLKDILLIVTNKGFWLIALLCVLFYSAVFPFLKYATDLMVNKYNVDPELAEISRLSYLSARFF